MLFLHLWGNVSSYSQLNVGNHTFHEVLSLSPTPSAPLGYRRLARRGSVAQDVLCFGTCIEVQNFLRPKEEANF
jgi:hypothetical protein